jgi:hypothetical protein
MVKLSKSAVIPITASIEMPDYVRLFKSAVMLIVPAYTNALKIQKLHLSFSGMKNRESGFGTGEFRKADFSFCALICSHLHVKRSKSAPLLGPRFPYPKIMPCGGSGRRRAEPGDQRKPMKVLR